jgi:hypothetical protein
LLLVVITVLTADSFLGLIVTVQHAQLHRECMLAQGGCCFHHAMSVLLPSKQHLEAVLTALQSADVFVTILK